MREKICYAILIFIHFLTSGTNDFGNDKNVIVGGWLLFTAAYFYLENLMIAFCSPETRPTTVSSRNVILPDRKSECVAIYAVSCRALTLS